MVCTMTLERLLSLATTGTAQVFNSLDALAQKYLGITVAKDVVDSAGDPVRTSFGKYIGRPPADIEQVALDYAAGDTDVVLEIWRAPAAGSRAAQKRCQRCLRIPGRGCRLPTPGKPTAR